MTITPLNCIASCRTGTLRNTTVAEITAALGFVPNILDDPFKVENSWGARVDGEIIAIWDYKGSHTFGQFSTYGPDDILEKLFGVNYHSDD